MGLEVPAGGSRMPVAKMMRVREDVEIRPTCGGNVPVVLENRDEALAYISQVTEAAAGYAVLSGLDATMTLEAESQPQIPTPLITNNP